MGSIAFVDYIPFAIIVPLTYAKETTNYANFNRLLTIKDGRGKTTENYHNWIAFHWLPYLNFKGILNWVSQSPLHSSSVYSFHLFLLNNY